MKPVVQEDITGCAIASAAAIAGTSYARVKRVANGLGIYADDPKLWSDTIYIRQILSYFGIATGSGQNPFNDWESLPDCALLAIKWHLEGGWPSWHWVVFVRESDQKYVLDSKKALKLNVRTDFGRIKPRWYIEVFAK